MAKTPVNSGLKRLQGELDGWVYRYTDVGTLVCRPATRTTIPPTEIQKNVRARFRQAAKYADAVFKDPARKEAYRVLAERRGIAPGRLFSYILGDFASPPDVSKVNVSKYHRHVGDVIVVDANDDGEVVGVTVALKRLDGLTLEEGAATLIDGSWHYLATTALLEEPVMTALVTARDRPGNETERSVFIRGTAPVIDAVEGSGYRGQVGDSIFVRASDDIGIANVFVMLRSAADVELESGDALLVDGKWRYLGQNAVTLPVRVQVSATDVTGKTTESATIVG